MTTQTPQSFSTSGPGGDPTLTGSEGGASVRERAGQVGGTAKDEAAGVAQEVKYQARDLVGEARTQVRQQVDTQKGRISDLLREVSEELEQMADRSDRSGLASDLARQAALRARDVRSYLDGDGDVLEDVRRFARRRPGTFLLGAVAAGVLAGRATRAAAAARQQQSGGQSIRPFTDTGSPGYSGEYTSYGTTGLGTGYQTGAGQTGAGYATGTSGAMAAGAYPGQPTGYPQATGYGTATPGTPSTAPGSGFGAGYESTPAAGDEPTTGYVAPADDTLPADREER